MLDSLVSDEAADDAELITALLSWDPTIDVDALATASRLGADRVRDALTQLGTAGRVGYDVAEAGCFHRTLPYAAEAVATMNPRRAGPRAALARRPRPAPRRAPVAGPGGRAWFPRAVQRAGASSARGPARGGWRLAPGLAELAAHGPDYARLLPDAPSPVAGPACCGRARCPNSWRHRPTSTATSTRPCR